MKYRYLKEIRSFQLHQILSRKGTEDSLIRWACHISDFKSLPSVSFDHKAKESLYSTSLSSCFIHNVGGKTEVF